MIETVFTCDVCGLKKSADRPTHSLNVIRCMEGSVETVSLDLCTICAMKAQADLKTVLQRAWAPDASRPVERKLP